MPNEFIICGEKVAIPSLKIIHYLDQPSLRLHMGVNGRLRSTTWIRSIVLHTTKGWPDAQNRTPQKMVSGLGKNQGAGNKCVSIWKGNQVGAHLVIDFDGTIYQCADLATEVTYHATVVNEVSIGIEIYQGNHSELYEGQLQCVLEVVDWLTQHFGIQRQFHAPYQSHSLPSRIGTTSEAGKNVVGIYGHRDVTTNRSEGDPGDFVFEVLKQAGYESFDFSKNEDIAIWKDRQAQLGITADGIPGPTTVKKLKEAGYPEGIWIKR